MCLASFRIYVTGETSINVIWRNIKKPPPDHKVMSVDLGSAAAVQQDPRVSHDGAASVMLVFHGRNGGQKAVEIFGDVRGAVAIKHIVDDVSRLQRAL